MKRTILSLSAAALAFAFATGAQAQDAPLPHINPPPPLPHVDLPRPEPEHEVLAGKWEWLERAGARPFFMEISLPKGNAMDVLVMWPQSLAARYFWQFTVRPEADGKTLSYTGARHWHEQVMVPEGEAPKQDVKYEDGSGALRIEGDTLLWDERKEGICKECRFRKAAPAVADADVPAVPDALELVSTQNIADALRVIGADGKGFHIVFDRVQRSADDPLRYTVTGKTQTGSGEQRKVRDFSGTLEVQRAGMQPRTPANAAHYKGYADGVMRGSIEAELQLQVGSGQPDGGAIAGTLRVPVLYGADGAIRPNHTLPVPGDSRPDHRLLAKGGYANGEFTGTWTPQGGASTPLTFSRMRFEGSGLRVLGYDPKADVFAEVIVHPEFSPAPPPKQ